MPRRCFCRTPCSRLCHLRCNRHTLGRRTFHAAALRPVLRLNATRLLRVAFKRITALVCLSAPQHCLRLPPRDGCAQARRQGCDRRRRAAASPHRAVRMHTGGCHGCRRHVWRRFRRALHAARRGPLRCAGRGAIDAGLRCGCADSACGRRACRVVGHSLRQRRILVNGKTSGIRAGIARPRIARRRGAGAGAGATHCRSPRKAQAQRVQHRV